MNETYQYYVALFYGESEKTGEPIVKNAPEATSLVNMMAFLNGFGGTVFAFTVSGFQQRVGLVTFTL